jgi:hypothetical protein
MVKWHQRRKRRIRRCTFSLSASGEWCGRLLRSCSAATPPSANRRRHLCPVRVLTPLPAAAQASPTWAAWSSKCARPWRVNLAFLWMFIWSLLEVTVVWKHQFLRFGQMNNLLKHYIYDFSDEKTLPFKIGKIKTFCQM